MIKIGILSSSLENLSNFEYRFYFWCLQQEWIKIEIIFIDGRIKTSKKNYLNKIIDYNFFSKLLFITINKIDDYFLKYKKIDNKKKDTVQKWLENIDKIKIFPINKKGNIDYFNDELSQNIKNYNLDLILRFGFNIINGKILNVSKHGIWSFHHADNDINRGGPAGFWEVLFDHKTTGVTLQRLNENLDGGYIIDKAHYVTQDTFKQNNIFVIEKSLLILFKNLKLLKNKKILYKESKEYKKKIYKYPTSLKIILKYLWVLIKNIIIKKIYYKFFYLLNYKIHHWTIFITNTNDFKKITLNNSQMIKTTKNYFYADPFYIKHNNIDYVFYEKFDYKKNIGHLSCSIIENNKFINEKTILKKDYHLSYPFIFYKDDNFYLLPEMSQSKKQQVFISKNFPYEWKLHKTIFNNVYCADPTIYEDDKKNLWLFINQSFDAFNDLNSELYIYRINNLYEFELESHSLNPVIIDSRKARNAGSIFKYNDNIIRPSQNTNSISYGNSLKFNKIVSLTIDDFKDEEIYNLEFKNRNIIGTHHFNMYKDKSLIDVCHRIF